MISQFKVTKLTQMLFGMIMDNQVPDKEIDAIKVSHGILILDLKDKKRLVKQIVYG